MDRYITNPKDYTFNDLLNYNWDVIELPITVDTIGMMNWYTEIDKNYSDSKFDLSMLHLLQPQLRDKMPMFIEKNLWGTPEQWTLQWSYDRDGVIPFIFAGDPDQFPEIKDPDFSKNSNYNLEKYYFGTYKKYVETFGSNCFKVNRLVRFKKNTGLKSHVDIEKPNFLIRMHLQIQVDDNAFWYYGENMERKYTTKPGHVYLFNTHSLHAAVNNSDNDWILLHNNPNEEAINQLLQLDSIHIN